MALAIENMLAYEQIAELKSQLERENAYLLEEIKTERLRLRPIEAADAALLVALDSDPEVMRFISGGAATPPDEAARIVARAIGHRWIAYERATGEFLGFLTVERVEVNEAIGEVEGAKIDKIEKGVQAKTQL